MNKLKSTGVVRRIDDLGRIVIPQEIRRSVGLRAGDPMELFVGRDEETGRPEITFRRYVVGDELEYLQSIVDSLDNLNDDNRKEFKANMIKLIRDQIKAEKGMNY